MSQLQNNVPIADPQQMLSFLELHGHDFVILEYTQMVIIDPQSYPKMEHNLCMFLFMFDIGKHFVRCVKFVLISNMNDRNLSTTIVQKQQI